MEWCIVLHPHHTTVTVETVPGNLSGASERGETRKESRGRMTNKRRGQDVKEGKMRRRLWKRDGGREGEGRVKRSKRRSCKMMLTGR